MERPSVDEDALLIPSHRFVTKPFRKFEDWPAAIAAVHLEYALQ